MNESPSTRPSLLIAIRDVENAAAWRQFVDIYTPLIFGFCVKRGLQQADAADVSQEVMKAVASAIRKFEYSRGRGSFRGWLLTVTRSKLNNFFAIRARQPQGASEMAVEDYAEKQATPDEEGEWEREFKQRLFHYAAAQIRGEFQEKTWLAFWKTGVDQQSAAVVAAELGMSSGAVYIARSRVIARLRILVDQLSEEHDSVDLLLSGTS